MSCYLHHLSVNAHAGCAILLSAAVKDSWLKWDSNPRPKTSALNWRLRPLGHPATCWLKPNWWWRGGKVVIASAILQYFVIASYYFKTILREVFYYDSTIEWHPIFWNMEIIFVPSEIYGNIFFVPSVKSRSKAPKNREFRKKIHFSMAQK